MVLALDVLHGVRAYDAPSANDLIATTGGKAPDVHEAISLCLARGWISGAEQGWGDQLAETTYTITQSGEEFYGRFLDCDDAMQLAGPAPASVPQRFLLALGERNPAQHRQLMELAETPDLKRGDEGSERRRAVRLAHRASMRWAHHALDSGSPEAAAAADALRSLPASNPEELGYLAQLARNEYAPALPAGALRQAVEHVAAASEGAWELRMLDKHDRAAGPLHPRPFDNVAAALVAEEAALALTALASTGKVDLVAEANAVVEGELQYQAPPKPR